MAKETLIEKLANIGDADASGRDPWHPSVRRWALLDVGGRVVDTQIEAPFLFIEGRRPMTIGRAYSSTDEENCDFRIRGDTGVSRQHCVLWKERGRWWIRDVGSTNGTFVGDIRVGAEPTILADNDSIRIGPATVLTFRHSEGLEENLVRTLCVSDHTGLPTRRFLEQAVPLAVRREGPVHLALVGAPRDDYGTFADGAICRLAEGLKRVAASDIPAHLFVAEVSSDPPQLGILFRGTPREEAEDFCQRWHAGLIRERGLDRANLAFVSVPSPYDRPVRWAREKLLGCELAGDGGVDVSHAQPMWCRGSERVFFDDVRRRRLLHVAVARTPRRSGASEFRSALARATWRLPAGSCVSIGWRERSRLWFVATNVDAAAFDEFLEVFQGHHLVRASPRDPGAWVEQVARQLESETQLDPEGKCTPLVQLLSAHHTNPTERLLSLSRKLESALRLLCALATARVGVELHARRADVGLAVDAIAAARERQPGLGTYLHLLTGLCDATARWTEEGDPLSVLATSGWLKRVRRLVDFRNRWIHSEPAALPDADSFEKALKELVEMLGHPRFQLVSVINVEDLRGLYRVDLQRLVGAVMCSLEQVDRQEWTDNGAWLELPGGSWSRLHPWLVARACPECGVPDVFSLSPVTVQLDRKLVLRGTHHPHEVALPTQHPNRIQELTGLLRRVGDVSSATPTLPGV